MLGAFFKNTGIEPFTRTAPLIVNRDDVQIGDALIVVERMEKNERKRAEVDEVVAVAHQSEVPTNVEDHY